MKLAYVITCHKNAKQVLRLIDRLNSAENTIVLHVSKTCEPGFFETLKGLMLEDNSYRNVFFCKREDGTHNSFGIVKGVINGLVFLFKNNIQFDYVSLISGQDYPIKSAQDISAFFEKNKGKQFFYFFPLSPKLYDNYEYDNSWGPNRQHYRIDRHHFIIDGVTSSIPELLSGRLIDHSLWDTIKIFLFESRKYINEKRFKREFLLLFWSRVLPRTRKLPTDFDIFGGKTWWSITADAARYVVDQHFNNKRYQKFFKYTLIPDEMYIHTILMNSHFAQHCVNNDLRDIEWEGGDGTHPIFFRAEHINRLKESKNLYARKFDTDIDSNILDLIDEEILNK
jgi:hypothetical protein